MTGSKRRRGGVHRLRTVAIGGAGVAAMIAGAAGVAAEHNGGTVGHVLLISVDGLHQSDLTWYVEHNPGSALAHLVSNGADFTNAKTPVPSDSFPGMVALATGGKPKTTGVYYDDTWNNNLLPAGTSPAACAAHSVAPGVEVTYFEQLDDNLHSIDAGQGLSNLPGNILNMTGDPTTLIDTTQLPVDPKTCKPVYPHQYIQTNTIFEVARAAGLRTAWSDKHPAYEILNGPSGTGVQDLFTPEINSDAPNLGDGNDWTTDNALTMQYDSYKVQAVVNEIEGFDHSGTTQVGTPAIFGMNFQTVSTAEKLPTSDGLTGGYELDASGNLVPGPLLQRALDYINTQIGSMQEALKDRHLDHDTTIILSAKHGQSPIDGSKLVRIPDGPILTALDTAWNTAVGVTTGLVNFAVDDDSMYIWLKDHSKTATDFAKNFLLNYNSSATSPNPGNNIQGVKVGYTSAGLAQVYSGADALSFFNFTAPDSLGRVPDIAGVVQVGTVYTGKKAKIAEHGGSNPNDQDVPIVVSGGPVEHHLVSNAPVETTQVAPTILQLLGLDPTKLTAVQKEGTQALPLG